MIICIYQSFISMIVCKKRDLFILVVELLRCRNDACSFLLFMQTVEFHYLCRKEQFGFCSFYYLSLPLFSVSFLIPSGPICFVTLSHSSALIDFFLVCADLFSVRLQNVAV